MISNCCGLFTLFASLISSVPCALAAPSQPLVITHARRVDIVRGVVAADQSVVVQGDVIRYVGPSSGAPVPPDARIIDAKNRFVMPGLVDMHAHIGTRSKNTEPRTLKDYILFVANGVTTVRNMAGYDYFLDHRSRLDRRELLGPRVFLTGPMLDGSDDPNAPNPAATVILRSPEQARAEVARERALGFDYVKIYPRISLSAYEAVEETARALGMPLVGHVPPHIGIPRLLRSGLWLTSEHLDGMDQEIESADSPFKGNQETWARLLGLRLLYTDADKVDSLARAIARGGMGITPTFAVHKIIADLASGRDVTQIPEVRYIDAGIIEWWNAFVKSDLPIPAKWRALAQQGYAAKGRLVRALARNGVSILAGTDQSSPYVVAGFSLHTELKELVRAGLSPRQALRAATGDAAKFLLPRERLGDLRPGFRADLVLLECDPMRAIDCTRRIQGVMTRGQWLSRAKLDQLLESIKP